MGRARAARSETRQVVLEPTPLLTNHAQRCRSAAAQQDTRRTRRASARRPRPSRRSCAHTTPLAAARARSERLSRRDQHFPHSGPVQHHPARHPARRRRARRSRSHRHLTRPGARRRRRPRSRSSLSRQATLPSLHPHQTGSDHLPRPASSRPHRHCSSTSSARGCPTIRPSSPRACGETEQKSL